MDERVEETEQVLGRGLQEMRQRQCEMSVSGCTVWVGQVGQGDRVRVLSAES